MVGNMQTLKRSRIAIFQVPTRVEGRVEPMVAILQVLILFNPGFHPGLNPGLGTYKPLISTYKSQQPVQPGVEPRVGNLQMLKVGFHPGWNLGLCPFLVSTRVQGRVPPRVVASSGLQPILEPRVVMPTEAHICSRWGSTRGGARVCAIFCPNPGTR